MTPLLRLEDVCSGYGQSQILWDVSLDVPRGGAIALIGRNGVGKSTLLNAIIGAQPLTAGRLMFDGWDIGAKRAHERARAGIGFVPQGRRIFPHLTVDENLRTGLSALGGRSSGKAEIEQVFELFPKLKQIRGRKGGFLSGGEQQQLAIGRALAGAPRLLLLDEPTEGVQPNVVDLIEEALREIRTSLGVTVLIVEQNLDFAWGFADGYRVMQGGQVIRSGDTRTESADEVAHLVSL